MKIKRLWKIFDKTIWTDISDYQKFYKEMKNFNSKIADITGNKDNAKTIVFATKMYGYGSRIVFDQMTLYPMDIQIPLDSRITKIFAYNNHCDRYIDKDIRAYYQDLSLKYNIPPLHLDSLLWIKYWDILKGISWG